MACAISPSSTPGSIEQMGLAPSAMVASSTHCTGACASLPAGQMRAGDRRAGDRGVHGVTVAGNTSRLLDDQQRAGDQRVVVIVDVIVGRALKNRQQIS